MGAVVTKEALKGLKEINNAKWVKEDNYGIQRLTVHNKEGTAINCYLTPRPYYCDRGHIDLKVFGPLELDEQDCFPRYFFSMQEADRHARDFLRWRLWKHSPYRKGSELW